MQDFGFWSIIPPVAAIVLAIRTRQVFISLIFGIWLGWVIINGGNVFKGTIDTIQGMVDVFKEDNNTRTIIFTLIIGILIAYIQRSGGVEGFILRIDRFLKRLEEKGKGRNRLIVQFLAALTGLLIFLHFLTLQHCQSQVAILLLLILIRLVSLLSKALPLANLVKA